VNNPATHHEGINKFQIVNPNKDIASWKIRNDNTTFLIRDEAAFSILWHFKLFPLSGSH
jgi:hypothetical protein